MNFLNKVKSLLSGKGEQQPPAQPSQPAEINPAEARAALGITPEIWQLVLKIKGHKDIEKGCLYYLGMNEKDLNLVRGIDGDNLDRLYFATKEGYKANRKRWRPKMFMTTEDLIVEKNLALRKLVMLTKVEEEKQDINQMGELLEYMTYLNAILHRRCSDQTLYNRMATKSEEVN